MTLLLSGHLKEQEKITALRSLAHGAGTSHFQVPRPQLISWNRLLAERTCLIWSLINLHSPLPPSSWAWCCFNELKLVMNRNPLHVKQHKPMAALWALCQHLSYPPHHQAYGSEQLEGTLCLSGWRRGWKGHLAATLEPLSDEFSKHGDMETTET